MFEDRTPLRPAELLKQKTGGFQASKQGAPLLYENEPWRLR
jgi:hypothetical protein